MLSGDLPSVEGYPVQDEGLKWVFENKKKAPNGCETIGAFSKRSGLAHATVTSLINKGLPNVDGYPEVVAGVEWVLKNLSKAPEGSQSIHAFSKDVGFSFDTVKKWIDTRGMPTVGGYVDVLAAKKWIDANIDLAMISRLRKPKPPAGFEARNTFGRRHGVSLGTVNAWMAIGLPCDGLFIDSRNGDEWVRLNADEIDIRKRLSRGMKPRGNASIGAFSVLIGVAKHHVRYNLIESGLPYEPKLGIPIQAGLEWVRDNRPDIVIPPEAWPTADNETATKTA
jgi:hypothetical protein